MLGNEIVHEDPILRMAARKNVTFAVWSNAPGLAQVQAFQRTSELINKRGGADQALVSVVVRGVPSFSEEVRDGFVRIIRNNELYRLGTAHLILLEGMAGTVVRAFLSTVRLLSRQTAPVGVFGKTEEALLWTLERLRGARERWVYSELAGGLEQATKDR
jgi:hypothetical protein